jgi:predicted DNA-binding transcriptional regulator AlpA
MSSGADTRPRAADLMTVREVLAELNGVSRDTFYRWRQLGVAPQAIRLPNGELRVRRSDFERWLNNLPGAA